MQRKAVTHTNNLKERQILGKSGELLRTNLKIDWSKKKND